MLKETKDRIDIAGCLPRLGRGDIIVVTSHPFVFEHYSRVSFIKYCDAETTYVTVGTVGTIVDIINSCMIVRFDNIDVYVVYNEGCCSYRALS